MMLKDYFLARMTNKISSEPLGNPDSLDQACPLRGPQGKFGLRRHPKKYQNVL